MRNQSPLLLAALLGGLFFTVSTASANCGSCEDDHASMAEKACPPDCDKPCCAGAKEMACPPDCDKPCCRAEGHKLVGQVMSVDAANRMVVVKHEAVEGVMEAMTMGFQVAECCDVAALKAGDRIEATMLKTEKGYMLKGIKPHAAMP